MFQPVLIHTVHWLIVPLCCLCAWALMALLLRSLWLAVHDSLRHLQRLHQIPCNQCAFFTGDYRLKCTVHPRTALSEEAIDCLDYQPAAYPVPTFQQPCKCSRF